MQPRKTRSIIVRTLLALASALALTSCGGGDSHNLNATQLAEVDAALAQVQAKERADEAALANALASGADATTIAQLKAMVVADESDQLLLLSAAPPTTTIVPAGEDEVSAAIAALFAQYGKDYQAVLEQSGAFHDQFVQT